MPKVLVELSGGVDSAVCAYLLKEQGYDVYGVTMMFHEDTDSGEEICKQLDIPFKMLDLREEFKRNVIDYFAETYRAALTPNPCIVCNKTMKFGLMFNEDFDYLATGHYARIKDRSLYRAKDKNKDQSYVLHFLNKKQLSKILFPLGEYTKDEVIDLSNNFNFPKKKESQDICFVPDGNYAKFISDNYNYEFIPGNIVDEQGNILGQHKGLINYTIGQRKGLEVAAGKPIYIKALDAEKNQIVVGNTETNKVQIKDFNWIEEPQEYAEAKLRYRQKQIPCKVKNGNIVELIFDNPVSAVTPGQFAVLYDGDKVLGGGTIC